LEDDISIELHILQSHLDGMLNRVTHNSLTLKRLQAFEMRLLGLSTLTEMIDFILNETKLLFDLEIVSLYLFDPTNDIACYLENDHYPYQSREGFMLVESDALFKKFFDYSHKPLLGIYHPENYEQFFLDAQQMPSSVILAPLVRRGKYIGSLNLGSYRSDRFIHTMATDFIEHLASVLSISLENTLTFETMRRTSLFDPLTGVNNRRFLEQRIDEELDRSIRTRQPLTCLFLDIDYFKCINDTYGHQAGDQVLSQVASAIKKQLRSNDVLARYGGEEFVALLSGSDEVIALEIAERIRSSIAGLLVQFDEQNIAVTISIGAATFNPDSSALKNVSDTARQLINAADAALYQAKHKGRNRVENSGGILAALDLHKVL
jgi:diguanylate cyclase (GGDEF)-like protein